MGEDAWARRWWSLLDEKRGRERGAEVARDALLSAAEAVFAERGFSAARIDDIAKKAGYNKALIFRYIGDKQTIYQAVVRHCLEEVTTRMGEFLAPFATDASAALDAERVRAFLERAVGWLFDFYVEHPNHRRILLWETAEEFRTFARWSLVMDRPDWRDGVVELLERARTGRIVRCDLDPISLITNVAGMALIYLASLPRYARLFPGHDFASEAALAQARQQMIALVVRGAMACPEGAHTEEGIHAVGV